jgi:type II secretory pathway component PulK
MKHNTQETVNSKPGTGFPAACPRTGRLPVTCHLSPVTSRTCGATCARDQDGIILIIVLFLALILSIVILQFQFVISVEKAIAQNRVESAKALYSVRSKVEIAKLAIIKGIPAAQPVPDQEHSEETEEAVPRPKIPGITITDASSRLNINLMIERNGTVNEKMKTAVENLLNEIGQDPKIADAIADCIDKDTQAGKDKAEQEDFPNRPLQNITELGIIKDIPPETLTPKTEGDESVKLYDYFTVFSKGKININTAPREVLLAILKNPTYEKAVDNIIKLRASKPFESVAELYTVDGASRGMFDSFEVKLTIKPTIFIAEISVTEGRITKQARAVFEKQRNSVRLLFYQEE